MGLETVSLSIAVTAGLLSFFSPCILPLIPVYIMYLAGSESNSKWIMVYRTLGFILGFTIIFMTMGLSASLLGQALARHKSLLIKISGIVMMIFGLNMLGVFKLKSLPLPKIKMPEKVDSFFGAVLMGLAFGAGWTPCFGPILASIVVYASTSATAGQGALLLFAYTMGLAIPFLLTSLFINAFDRLLNKYEKFTKYAPILSGIMLIIFGLLVFTNRISTLNQLFF